MPVSVGATVTIFPQFIPDKLLEEILNKRITFLCGAPGMYIAFLNVLKEKQYDISSLRIVLSGGAPLPFEVYKAYLDKYNLDIIEGCGPTEAPTFAACPVPVNRFL
jgi:long-chain acyl-CoA synthetase